MWPARSAYTRFWDGTAKTRPPPGTSPSRGPVSNARIASAVVRPGCSAVHASATPYPRRGGGRPSTGAAGRRRRVVGDVREDRAVPGGPHRQRDVIAARRPGSSPSRAAQRQPRAVVAPASPSTRSRNRSVTSGPRLVKPQAMSALCPMTTPGHAGEREAGDVERAVRVSVVQCRPICIQMPGSATPRCGSLASSGCPVAEWSPSTTQLLLADAVAVAEQRRASGRSARRSAAERRAPVGGDAGATRVAGAAVGRPARRPRRPRRPGRRSAACAR